MAETERERPLAKYHERIPDGHRSRGWRVQLTRCGEAGERTLCNARLTNGSRTHRRYVDSGFLGSEEDAVDDAVQELMRLEPLD